MTTKEEIDLIIKEQYNNYQGNIFQELRDVHKVARNLSGDDAFLEFLKKCKEKNPRPIYVIPEGVKQQMDKLCQQK